MDELSVFIETHGCQMNEYDSDRILNSLSAVPAKDPSNADIIIVNTCAIREKANHKAVSAVGKYKNLKKSNPNLLIGMAGCVAQLYGNKLIKQIPYLDFVVGPRGIPKLMDIINNLKNSMDIKRVETSIDIEEVFEINPYHEEGKVNGFVSIQQGCNKKCAYCIVPTVRGTEINRPLKDILEESRLLINRGAKELTYIGQTVNSWKYNGEKFHNLLDYLQELDGLERIRFTTSFPRDVTTKMINAMKNNPKVCKHLHLPVQSGSDKVLKSMNRTYSIAWYKDSVSKLKDAIPDLSISTDIIVGFCNENDDDFEQTMELVEEIKFDTIYSFKYSIRPGTEGEKMDFHVPDQIASNRLLRLQERQREISLESNTKDINRTYEVLIEGISKNNPDDLFGRTTHNKVVNIRNLDKSYIGKMINVNIKEAFQNSLVGAML